VWQEKVQRRDEEREKESKQARERSVPRKRATESRTYVYTNQNMMKYRR